MTGRGADPARFGLPADPESRFFTQDRVHLYYADVDAFPAFGAILRESLSDRERARGERLRRREDRDRFLVARGLLRAILGVCVGRDPADIPLVDGPGGKPMIGRPSNPRDIRFSVSHTGRRVLFAVARSREVGVDVEKIRPDFPVLQASGSYFTPREASLIRALPEPGRAAAFFGIWTMKEAFLKGTGEGLSLPLDRLEVTLEPPEVFIAGGGRQEGSRWSMRALHPETGYVAALAVEGGEPRIRLRELRLSAGDSAR